MSQHASWKVALAAAVVLGMVGGQTCAAQCTTPDVPLGGIWLYPVWTSHFSMTVVNLTDYQLRSTLRSSTPSPVVTSDEAYPYPFQNLMDPISIAPYRSALWKSGYSGAFGPQRYGGRIRFQLSTAAGARSFDVNFATQAARGAAVGRGTWIALSQVKFTPVTNEPWCLNSFCGGVWSTPWMDPIDVSLGWNYNMHNVMTLTTPDLVVALYSPDNLNIVLVVRQTHGGNDYAPLLDFVDNDGRSVPGDCNN